MFKVPTNSCPLNRVQAKTSTYEHIQMDIQTDAMQRHGHRYVQVLSHGTAYVSKDHPLVSLNTLVVDRGSGVVSLSPLITYTAVIMAAEVVNV